MAARAMAQAEWFVDPQNVTHLADNDNDGETAETPLLTWREIIRRWGTRAPQLQVAPVFTALSDSDASDDFSVDLTFTASAGSEPTPTFNGTLFAIGSATIGTFTPRDRGTSPGSGTPNKITAQGESGAFWTPFAAAQALVHDVTADAWFRVDADLGSATAVISEPVASCFNFASFPPAYKTIADGDSLIIYRTSTFYSAQLTSPNAEAILLQHIALKAPGGIAGTFRGSLEDAAAPLTCNECSLDNIFLNGGVFITNTSVGIHADVVGHVRMISGNWQGTQGHHAYGFQAYDGDVLMNCLVVQELDSIFYWGRVYFGSLALFEHSMNATTIYINGDNNVFYPDPVAWGPGTLTIPRGTALFIGTTFNAVDVLRIHFTRIDECTEAYAWQPGAANPFGAIVAVSAASIDAAKATFNGTVSGGLMGIGGQTRALFGA
ncbi:MAG: hypothetical protein ACREU5_06875 [Burkholderiales bacterium]